MSEEQLGLPLGLERKRPYELTITDLPGGYGWDIEVDGEVIATSHRAVSPFTWDARQHALSWAHHHEEMGYEFRKNWWEYP
jgi:hypothetical protein